MTLDEQTRKRIAQIQSILQTRDTEDLLEIWRANDRVEWSPEAFVAIRNILEQRLGEVPAQSESRVERLARAEQMLKRAEALENRGNFAEALAECDQAIQAIPDFALAHYYRGLQLDALGRLLDAIHAYEEAVRLDPQLGDAQEALREAEQEWADSSNAAPHEPIELPAMKAESDVAEDEDEAIESDAALAATAFLAFEAALVDEGVVPPEYYLSEAARLVRGHPGYRTRPGRSGYDPLDTDFEAARIQGLLLRQLFTGQLRLDHPAFLLIATLIGLAAVMPLVWGGVELFNGDRSNLPMILVLSWYWVPGLALLWNVVRNVRALILTPESEEDEEAA